MTILLLIEKVEFRRGLWTEVTSTKLQKSLLNIHDNEMTGFNNYLIIAQQNTVLLGFVSYTCVLHNSLQKSSQLPAAVVESLLMTYPA